jgi:hypothetical protein
MYQNDSFLTDILAVVAQNWVDEFRKTWGLDALDAPNGIEHKTWEAAKLCDQIAAQIFAASRTLECKSGNLYERLNTLRDKLGLDLEQDPFFVQLLEARLASDLDDELNRMRLRALKLLRYLVDVKTERARAYLMRVAACFMRGFKTETVVMCGAVIDAALQELLDDKEVRASIHCGRNVFLGHRIDFMGKSERWNEDTVNIAFKLAKERNNAIHTSPELVRGVDEVIEDLVLLLSRIH